ncbi:hypothetical protein [Acinetobacter sp. CWB-B33]|uniref:hypothetical protein n=1 Tax=Acinetobacter sp. CWB-B33 TaxID=2815724 RepID=UPI0031FEFE74
MRRIDFIEEIERNRCSAVKLAYIRSIKCGIYKKLDRIYWAEPNAGDAGAAGSSMQDIKLANSAVYALRGKIKKRGNNNCPKSA